MECVLKDLIAVSKDGEWGKGEAFEESVEMLAVRGTDFEDVRFGSTVGVPRRHIAKRHAERKILQPWDVVIEAAGGTKNQITGRTVLLRPQLFSRSDLPLTCASFSRFIRFNTELCDPAFMFWYLQHLYASGSMHAYHTQHTGVARFQWTTFSEREPLEIPSLDMQRRVAGILSAYDELIENSQRRIRILETMARALYREWFVHFRFPGHENFPRVASSLGEIPEGWDIKALGDIAENFDRMRKPLSKMVRAEMQGEYPYYGAAKVFDYVNNYIFDGEYLLLAEDGSVITPDRAPVLQLVNEKFWPNNHTHVLRGRAPFSTHFLYLGLADVDISPYITGAAQPKITQENMNRIPFFCGPEPVHKAFDGLVMPMLRQSQLLQRQVQNLRRTRELLLPRLLSGQIGRAPADLTG